MKVNEFFEWWQLEGKYAASLLVIQKPVDLVQNPDLILAEATDNLTSISSFLH